MQHVWYAVNMSNVDTGASKGDLMNTKDVCDLLRISRGTLHKRIRDGKLTPIRENPALEKQRLLFHREQVEKLARGEG